MRFATLLSRVLCAAVLFVSLRAEASGDSAALDELKQGYSLKQLGNCHDAVPHLARSVQLKPTSKALLNLSDCEQRLGELVAAQGHAAQGREMARQQSDQELVAIADEQLTAIDKRLPRLTIRVSPEAPAGTTVLLDGAPVDATSIGAAVSVNPGAHIVVVSAANRADRRFDMTMDEGDRNDITVEPGPNVGSQPESAVGAAATKPEVTIDAATNASRRLALVALGVGAAGLALGVVTGIMGSSTHDTLVSECLQNVCPVSVAGDLDSFRTLRTVSTVGYVIGAVGVLGGAVLWFMAPSIHNSAAGSRLWLDATSGGIGGRF